MEYPAPPPDDFSAFKDDASLLAAIYDHFSVETQRVIAHAQEEARRIGESYVSTEHLLLALVRQNDNDATLLIDRLGVSIGRVRSEIERQLARSDGRERPSQWTPRALRVLTLAYDESSDLPERQLTPQHLLFGLVRERDGLAGRVLSKLGITLEGLRAATAWDNKPATTTERTPLQRLGSNARRALTFARQEARGSESIQPGHLLLGLLREPNNAACSVLTHLGVDHAALARNYEIAPSGDLPEADAEPHLSADSVAVFERASHEANTLGIEFIGTEHILLGVIGDLDAALATGLGSMNVTLDTVRAAIRELREASAPSDPANPFPDVRSWSEGARSVIAMARHESARLSENYVSTEHLLLGILHGENGSAVLLLERLGVSLNRIRSEIERQVARGDGRSGQNMQLTPRAKRVIDLAYDEKRQLGETLLTERHMLLGLIREGEGLAGRVLNKLGVTLERARQLAAGKESEAEAADTEGEGKREKPMWQRFSERARRAVFFAQEEARRIGENYVSTEHMLLALLREPDSVSARILVKMGLSLDGIRANVERVIVRGDGRLGQDMQLTPRCKQAIDYAYEEARKLKCDYIGTEHLLLGLIREREGLAGCVLKELGIELEHTRREVVEFQKTAKDLKAEGKTASKPAVQAIADLERQSLWQRWTERARQVVQFASEAASQKKHNFVSTEHFLLGLLHETEIESVARRILHQLGTDADVLRAAVEGKMEVGEQRLIQGGHLTPRAKRVVDLAYDEARQQNCNYIGTEHLLLGMILEGEGVAGRTLFEFHVDAERVRQELNQLRLREEEAKVEERQPATLAPLQPLPDDTQDKLNALMVQKSGDWSASRTAEPNGVEVLNIGDVGVARPWAGRARVEMVPDVAAFISLDAIFQSKDVHGYRAMFDGTGQSMYLLPANTALKMLATPPGIAESEAKRGLFVRVLNGKYEGYAGWMFRRCFERTGSDTSDFPPPEEPDADRPAAEAEA